MIVTIEHVRQARAEYGGYCVRGMGAWFDRNGLSLRTFLREGYPVETLAAVGDEFANRVVAVAQREQGGA